MSKKGLLPCPACHYCCLVAGGCCSIGAAAICRPRSPPPPSSNASNQTKVSQEVSRRVCQWPTLICNSNGPHSQRDLRRLSAEAHPPLSTASQFKACQNTVWMFWIKEKRMDTWFEIRFRSGKILKSIFPNVKHKPDNTLSCSTFAPVIIQNADRYEKLAKSSSCFFQETIFVIFVIFRDPGHRWNPYISDQLGLF